MKNKINNITKMGMLLGLISIMALFAPVQSSASGKPPHGGGSGGGLPYAIASTVSQLIADIKYANSAGGAITVNLAAGTTFDLTSADNSTDGGNGLPVIGGTKAVALTILGNGDTIERIAVISRYYTVKNPFRLFDVAPGASLTIDHVTLRGGWLSGSGSAILNQGTLNVINGSTLSGNTAGNGGGIYNYGGTVTVSNSILSGNGASGDGGGICNAGGTVTIINSTLSGNGAFYGGGIYNDGGTLTVSNGTLYGNGARFGGGIYNIGGTITIKDSTVNDNSANHYDYPWYGGYGGGIYNSAGEVVIHHSALTGNAADPGLEDWFAVGGGIFNDSQGTVTVENDSHITENYYDDVNNLSVLYLDLTSTIDILDGNSAISF
jgi:hypothetical protein